MKIQIMKNDLLNKLNNDLYMCEIELERTTSNNCMSYSIQLLKIEEILEDIVLINSKISALNQYFKD